MTYPDFIREFAPVIQVFGVEHFPKPVLERAYFKTQDLTRDELKELCVMIIDTCEYAPKVPRIVEMAKIVRTRRAESFSNNTPIETGPRTEEVAKQALATISNIFRLKRPPNESEGA